MTAKHMHRSGSVLEPPFFGRGGRLEGQRSPKGHRKKFAGHMLKYAYAFVDMKPTYNH